MRVFFLLTCWMMGSALAQEGVGPEKIEIPLGVELGLQGGYFWSHHYDGGDHPGPGARLHVLLRLGSHIAVGPEVALFAHAGSFDHYYTVTSGETYDVVESPLFHLGGLVKIGGDLGPLHPSVLLGAGWYKGTASSPGGSLGAEVEVHFTKSWSVVPLVRYHFFHFVGPELGLGVHWTG